MCKLEVLIYDVFALLSQATSILTNSYRHSYMHETDSTA